MSRPHGELLLPASGVAECGGFEDVVLNAPARDLITVQASLAHQTGDVCSPRQHLPLRRSLLFLRRLLSAAGLQREWLPALCACRCGVQKKRGGGRWTSCTPAPAGGVGSTHTCVFPKPFTGGRPEMLGSWVPRARTWPGLAQDTEGIWCAWESMPLLLKALLPQCVEGLCSAGTQWGRKRHGLFGGKL